MSGRADLKNTGAYPGIQAILEWALGAEVAVAARASNTISNCVSRGIVKSAVSAAFARCESPAERQFMLGFFLGDTVKPAPDNDQDDYLGLVTVTGIPFHFAARQQVEITDYDWECDCKESENGIECEHQPSPFARLDFTLEACTLFEGLRHTVEIAVEIDGHEFHEKTKEQARADKSRDRRVVSGGQLISSNISCVLRFTGAEVFEDPERCVREAILVLRERVDANNNLARLAHDLGARAGYARRGQAIVAVAQESAEAAE